MISTSSWASHAAARVNTSKSTSVSIDGGDQRGDKKERTTQEVDCQYYKVRVLVTGLMIQHCKDDRSQQTEQGDDLKLKGVNNPQEPLWSLVYQNKSPVLRPPQLIKDADKS